MEAIRINEPKYELYVLSYNDKEREVKMIKRLTEVGITANICSFSQNDSQVNDRNVSCFINHLAMMEQFYHHSKKEYGVFIENDIYLKKTLGKNMLEACNAMQTLNLDVLLIGYLINKKPEVFDCEQIYNDKLGNTYYQYGTELWGTQGYILSKKQAKYYIDKYTTHYIKNCDETISADWIFTKQGNRALMYPPLVVEEGIISDKEHQGQINFHKSCKEFLYNSSYTS